MVQKDKDLRWVEALMKAVWGTDERCQQPGQRAESDAMLDRAERRVERLQARLEQRPPDNLDQAMRELTRSEK